MVGDKELRFLLFPDGPLVLADGEVRGEISLLVTVFLTISGYPFIEKMCLPRNDLSLLESPSDVSIKSAESPKSQDVFLLGNCPFLFRMWDPAPNQEQSVAGSLRGVSQLSHWAGPFIDGTYAYFKNSKQSQVGKSAISS